MSLKRKLEDYERKLRDKLRKLVVISFRIERDLLDKLEQLSEITGEPKSAIIRRTLREHVERELEKHRKKIKATVRKKQLEGEKTWREST